MVTYVNGPTPAWIDALEITGNEARLGMATLACESTATTNHISVRSGVRPDSGTPLKVSAAGGMNVTVDAGLCVVQGETSTSGCYLGGIDATATLTVNAAHGSLPRYDIVVMQVDDNGDATSTWRVKLIDGTPASPPTIPSTPAGALRLANIYVGAGVSSITSGNISDVRVYTVASGGVLPCSSAPTIAHDGQLLWKTSTSSLAVMESSNEYPLKSVHVCTSGTRPAGKFQGTFIYETDTGKIYFWTGTTYVLYAPITTDWTSYTPTWTAASVNPSLGNGTIAGRYQVIGGTCHCKIALTMGSTTTYGTGTWYFSSPVATRSSGVQDSGSCWVYDSSGGQSRLGIAATLSSDRIMVYTDWDSQMKVGVPFTWANGDLVNIGITFEVG